MQTVTVWCAAPAGPCMSAIEAALRVAQGNVISCGHSVTLTKEPLPEDLPDARLYVGSVTSVRHAAIAVINEPVDSLPDETMRLLRRARELQTDGRSVSVNLYTDSAVVAGAHHDFAEKFPGDHNLRPWQLQVYTNTIHLVEMLAIDLVDSSAPRWDDLRGGM